MRVRAVLIATALAAGVARADPVPPPATGGTVEGQVLRAGRPVPGVRVEVRRLFDLDDNMNGYSYRVLFERMLAGPEAWSPVATVVSDAAGRFAVPGLPPGVYDAEASGAGFLAATSVTLPLAGARVEANVSLPSGARTVRGRVVLVDGSRFSGRLLWTTASIRGEHEGMTVRGVPVPVEPDGRFAFACPATEKVVLATVEPGRRLVFSEPLDPRDSSPVVLGVDEGFEALDVRVVDAVSGAGLGGAVLLAKGATSGGGFAMVRGEADATGACALRGIGADRGEVWAYVQGYEETGVHGVGGSKGHGVVVRMRKCARVTGRVLREDGRPAAGLSVHAAPARRRAIDWPHGHARTDADGRYAIEDAQAGDVLVYAEGPGWVTPGADASEREERNPLVRTLAPGETTTADLRVVPAGILRGRVVDADGRPVGGAVVRALTYTLDPRGWVSFAGDPAIRAVAATGEDGRFVLDRLDAGKRFTLQTDAVGYFPWTVEDATAEAAPTADVEIRLPVARWIDVLVVDGATNRPVEGARIEVTTFPRERAGGGSRGFPEVTGRTGVDGSGRVGPLPDEPFRVRATMDGYVAANVWSREEPPFEGTVTARLGRPTTLSGHVYLPDGTPAAGQTVTFETGWRAPFHAVGRATADAAGAFSFHDAAPCALEVKADVYETGRGRAVAEAAAHGGDREVVLRLRPESPSRWNAGSPALEVRAVDGAGSPIPAALLTVRAPNDVVLTAVLEDGVATVRGFPRAAPLTVEVEDARDARGRRLPWVRTRVEVAPGTAATTVRLDPGFAIEGRVVDADGEGVARVRLAAARAEGVGALFSSGFDARATTDAEGRFRIGGLEPGPWVVAVDPPARWVPDGTTRADAGARDVAVRLRPATSVTVRVVSPSGRRVPGAVVRFWSPPPTPRVLAATTDAQGEAVLGGLDPVGEGTLIALTPDGSSVPLERWTPKDVEVRVGRTEAERRTDVVAHPDAPLVKGHNVLWCATSQLAWDALAEALGRAFPSVAGAGRLRLLPPARAEAVERMNRRAFPRDAIDPKASVVVGGLARDGVAERIREAWTATFGPDAALPHLDLSPLDAVGVAGLAKELPFAQPFHVHETPLAFDGGSPSVRAWGMLPYSTGPGSEAAAKQLTAYVPPGLKSWEPRPTTVVEIRPADPQERIVLARLDPKPTLEGTWADVEEILRTWQADTVDPGSLFVAPTIRLDAAQEFREFVGGPLEGIPGSELVSFHERVRFRLSEHGASVGAASEVVLSLGIHPNLVFDRPFLVALRRADATVPYFLLWVGNDALLERLVPRVGRPPDAATLEPLVGRWKIDRERSWAASTLRSFALWGDEGMESLGFPAGSKPTPDEILARAREKRPPEEDGTSWDVRLWVHESGHFVWEAGIVAPGSQPERREEGVVELLDGHLALRFDAPAGTEPAKAGDPYLPLPMRDGFIEIPMSAEVWALRRR